MIEIQMQDNYLLSHVISQYAAKNGRTSIKF